MIYDVVVGCLRYVGDLIPQFTIPSVGYGWALLVTVTLRYYGWFFVTHHGRQTTVICCWCYVPVDLIVIYLYHRRLRGPRYVVRSPHVDLFGVVDCGC